MRWFSTLSEIQRVGWANYATAVSMKNKLGESMNLSGFNMYIRSNLQLQRLGGLGWRDTAPVVFELAEKDPTVVCTPDLTIPHIGLTFDNTLGWANETQGYMFVYQGRPQNKTCNFFNGPWRYMGLISGVLGAPPASPYTFPTFPFPIALGQKQWLMIRIARGDGRMSEPFTCVGTVQA
jgi:hypothetical protein